MALSTAGFLMLAVVYAAAAAAAAAATAGGCNVCEFARGSLFVFFLAQEKRALRCVAVQFYHSVLETSAYSRPGPRREGEEERCKMSV